MYREKPLTSLVTGATAAMIALTGCVLYLADYGNWWTGGRFWPLILASSCATLLVMSLLHSDLQRLYGLLADRERKAHDEARTDLLTGLANRKSLGEQIGRRLSACAGQAEILCLLDLNHFKRVNDTRGHESGDELLVQTAARLRDAVPEALIARLGGDEFAIVAKVDGLAGAEAVCRAIVAVFAEPFVLSQGECFTRGSVGAAFLQQGLSTSEVLSRADAAMYKAKTDPLSYRLFDDEMIVGIARRSSLAVELRRSAPRFEDCSVVYQPILAIDGALTGLEALLRWKSAAHGEIPPAEAIAVAEEVHLINELGLLVARQACRAAVAFPEATVALNVSVVQLLDGRFDRALRELVAGHGLACGRLQLEVNERDFTARGPDIAAALQSLKAAGFAIAVDDFGSSTSSLVQLQKLGVSVLKLDPNVLRNAQEVGSIAVMRAKVELGKALGMTVICEGVGVEADRAAAIQAGCDMLQGFLLGKPLELAAVRKIWLRQAA